MRSHASIAKLAVSGAVVLMSFLIQGCDGCPRLKTIDLPPANFVTSFSGFAGSFGFCTSAGHIPNTAFWPPPSGQVQVGFDDYYQPGTNPFPCDDIRNLDFRAGVLFDLSQFDSVGVATLIFDTAGSVDRSGGETIGQNPPKSWATNLGLASVPFKKGLPDDNEVSLGPGPTLQIGVTDQVRDCVNHARPNNGFVISGPNAPASSGSRREDNDAKISWYRNFILRVTYAPSSNPRAPQ